MQRRSFLGALTAATLGVGLKGTLAKAAANFSVRASKTSDFPQNSTVVLVHAAWADGSCWANIILPLERRGLHVICAPIPMTSLTDDANALSRALERTSGAVILVGHAYSGAVIAAVQQDRVKSLVYIAALAPDEGETVAKVFYRDEPSPEQPKMVPDSHNFVWLPEDAFRRALVHKATADQASIAAAVQRPIAVECIQEAAPKPAWKTKPTWYLVAEKDRMINPKTQYFMAERMGAKIRPRPVDHTPMYSDPKVVIDVILEAAYETLSK